MDIKINPFTKQINCDLGVFSFDYTDEKYTFSKTEKAFEVVKGDYKLPKGIHYNFEEYLKKAKQDMLLKYLGSQKYSNYLAYAIDALKSNINIFFEQNKKEFIKHRHITEIYDVIIPIAKTTFLRTQSEIVKFFSNNKSDFETKLNAFVSANKEKYIVEGRCGSKNTMFHITEIFVISQETFCENKFEFVNDRYSYAEYNIRYDADYSGMNRDYVWNMLHDFINDFSDYCTQTGVDTEIEIKVVTAEELLDFFSKINHWFFDLIIECSNGSEIDFNIISDFGANPDELKAEIWELEGTDVYLLIDFFDKWTPLEIERKDGNYTVKYPKDLGLEYFYF